MNSVVALLVACTPTSVPGPTGSVAPTATPSVSIRVLVTRADGERPLPGARVCAATSRGADTCAQAAADGTATLHGPRGTYFVRVDGPAEQLWQQASRVADASAGDAGVWVELTPMHRISGRVTDDNGAAVSGADACAHPASDDPEICARSGPDGTYAIDVKAAIYRVEVTGPAGLRLVGQWARGRSFLEEADIADARTADVTRLDVSLVHGAVLKGTVTWLGDPVENAQVCIRTLAAPLPWDCERTDKKGEYVALREPGRYYVWIVPPGNIPAVPQWFPRALTGVGSSAVDLSPSEDVTIDVSLTAGPSVSGVVRSTSGDPVAGALVCIDTAFASGRICRESDGNGRYTITTRPETYIVSVFPPAASGLIAEFWDGKRTWIDADPVTVSHDLTLDLTVRTGVPVTGTVKDPRGVPIAGATINFMDGRTPGSAASTDTDAAGRFSVAVPPGRYTVEVFPAFVGNHMERVLTVGVRGAMDVPVTLDDVPPIP